MTLIFKTRLIVRKKREYLHNSRSITPEILSHITYCTPKGHERYDKSKWMKKKGKFIHKQFCNDELLLGSYQIQRLISLSLNLR